MQYNEFAIHYKEYQVIDWTKDIKVTPPSYNLDLHMQLCFESKLKLICQIQICHILFYGE